MRKRRKQKKLFGRMSIMYIVMIIALSTAGVGYAAWGSGINLFATMKTGNVFPQMEPKSLEYGGLDYKFLDDNTTLYISGQVYPGSNRDISIGVKDNGSIPTILNDIDERNTTDIVNLGGRNRNRNNRRSLFMKDAEIVETFQISINANEDNESIMGLSSKAYVQARTNNTQSELDYIQSEIDNIHNEIEGTNEEIKRIKQEIKRLENLREKHNFEYNLKFQQDL